MEFDNHSCAQSFNGIAIREGIGYWNENHFEPLAYNKRISWAYSYAHMYTTSNNGYHIYGLTHITHDDSEF